TIGTLPGTAVPGGGASYQFTDPTPVAAQSYYRIELTSNSFSQYSGLVLLSNTSVPFNARLVQNPFVDQINMEITAPSTGTATISLIDMFGRSLRRVVQPVNQGLNSISLYGLGSLPAATYALQIQYGDHLVSQKVVKVDK
ncbi:MAG TPA: T9SS type A sorting domain-containing protein, partial [Puia sp.]|nr:T9SS type A sorting domain-containing protein [Puia sp.]